MPKTRLPALFLSAALLLAPAVTHAQDGVPRGESGAVKKEEAQDQPPASGPVLPRIVKYVAPVYPPEAKAKGVEAKVVVQLDIDKAGKVTDVQVLSPAGHGFDEAAVAAGKLLEFTPAQDATGKIVASRIQFRFTFELGEEQPTDQPTDEPSDVQGLSGTVVGQPSEAQPGAATEEVPIPGAKVTLTPRDGTAARVLETDAEGRFDFGELPVGSYDVKVEAEGYSSSDLVEEITAGASSQVKYRVFVATGGVEVTVRGERPPREVVKRTLSKREINRIPGTNGDALRSIQNLPGVARPPAIIGLLLVRGSGPADTQTFIDGTPVPLIYHFGGLSSVVPTEMLDKIDFYPGNFGAEYGRVMGGIVDVGLRKPKDDGYHGLVQTDLIDTRAMVQGPIADGWTFAVAGRRSYLDAWLGPTLEAAGAGVTQAPVYWDYQALLEHNSAKAGRFRFGFFGSDDSLELLLEDPAPGEPALSGSAGLKTAFQRIQLLYERDLGKSDKIRAVGAFGHDELGFSLGPLYFFLDVLSYNTRAEWTHEFSKAVKLNAGFDIFSGVGNVRLRLPEQNTRPGEPPNQPFSTRPFRELEQSEAAIQSALYTELELEPAPGIRLVPGVRLDYTSFGEEFTFSPRFSGRFGLRREFPKTTLKTGIGVYHQPPSFQQAIPPLGTEGVKSNRAIHYALGLEQEITPQVDASAEGFVKQLDNQIVGNAAENGAGLVYTNSGRGYAAGGEFLIRYKPDERFFGWLAYTLSRSVRQNAPGEEEFLVNFDQTHILTVLGSVKLGHGWEIGSRFRLVSGNIIDPIVCDPQIVGCNPLRTNALFHGASGAYTPIPIGNNSERLPLFHSLDIRVDKKWKFKYWAFSIYLDVQNVYNNQNPEAVGYNFNYTARQYVNGLPILPSLGIRGDLGEEDE
ncbi:MAG: TonB-dependent receptor [Polyangiaceae bacterium]|nr:TonB-dependent receptor [Polyangiaceae bacterium]